jgi:folate-binding protein YgfZ
MSESSRVANLSSRALIAVGGADWRSFLQGLLTQDVETLAAGEARFAALLTPQGRLLHDLFLVGRDDGCWLDCQASARAALLQRLSMYRLRAKVSLELDDARVFAAWGAPPAGDGWIADPRLPALGWRAYGLATTPDASEPRYELHRLAVGVPGPADWGEDATYPLEADFDLLNGIDFRKGCFVGQETTSRMKRRGAIKSRMLPISFDGPPAAAGAEILAGTLRAGQVLSGVDGLAMALVRLDRVEGASLMVEGRPCTVLRPPWAPS